jgi:transcriptional regulator with XRE-family HTH domain
MTHPSSLIVNTAPGFGARLRALRKVRGLSGPDLSARVEINIVSLYKLEGEAGRQPRQTTLDRLAIALETPAKWLIYGGLDAPVDPAQLLANGLTEEELAPVLPLLVPPAPPAPHTPPNAATQDGATRTVPRMLALFIARGDHTPITADELDMLARRIQETRELLTDDNLEIELLTHRAMRAQREGDKRAIDEATTAVVKAYDRQARAQAVGPLENAVRKPLARARGRNDSA